MAIQFPNFLGVPINKADYSGIANALDNFYSGYNMPKDALIKEIQAKFAQPKAEQELKSATLANEYQTLANKFLPETHQQSILSSKLANRKTQLDIDKYVQELQQQKMFENQLRAALNGSGSVSGSGSGGGGGGGVGNMPSTMVNNMPPGQAPSMMQNNQIPNIPIASPQPAQPQFIPQSNQMPFGENVPVQTSPSMEMPKETIVSKGSPQLAGIDLMYENNPLSRAFLEKKGYKKTEQIKYDNKTGKTTLITKYPSGKITTQSVGGKPESDETPLTNAMVTRHQKVISSVDNLLPTLQKLRDLESHRNIYLGGNLTATHSQKKYQRLVNAAKEGLIGAFALNPTDKGLQTAIDQLDIGGLETEKQYKEAINDLIKDLKEKKAYSENLVKKSNKIQPVNSFGMDLSDLHNFDNAGESE